MNKYQEIINLIHYEPKRHKRMSMENRAAQFAPFAALTGYEESINEAGRMTNEKIILSDDLQEVINDKIRRIKENIKQALEVKITYFVMDLYKTGGSYQTVRGIVKKVDENSQVIIMKDKQKLRMDMIIDIEIIGDVSID